MLLRGTACYARKEAILKRTETFQPAADAVIDLERRHVLGTVAFGLAAAAVAPEAQAAPPPRLEPLLTDGRYPTVGLTRDLLRITAVQSRIRAADPKNPKAGLKANLDHMLMLIDEANGFPGPQDLVCFHEQPLMGWNPWTRDEALRVSIEVPGEETEALGKKAKQYGCFVAFGTFARDAAWPGHLLSMGVLIGPDGGVRAKHWKAHNYRELGPKFDLYTTAIYDVLDRYVEMYGRDAVLPVARTEIGNLSLSAAPGEPEVFRALAMKGTEISLRTSSGGYVFEDPMMTSAFNNIYTVIPNNSVSPDNPNFPEYSGGGETAIFGPRGVVVARAKSMVEEFVTGVIPIAAFRKTHHIPEVPMALVLPVFEQYTPRYSPNLQAEYIPSDFADAARYLASKRNW